MGNIETGATSLLKQKGRKATESNVFITTTFSPTPLVQIVWLNLDGSSSPIPLQQPGLRASFLGSNFHIDDELKQRSSLPDEAEVYKKYYKTCIAKIAENPTFPSTYYSLPINMFFSRTNEQTLVLPSSQLFGTLFYYHQHVFKYVHLFSSNSCTFPTLIFLLNGFMKIWEHFIYELKVLRGSYL